MQSTSVAFHPDGSLLLVGDGRHRQRLVVLDGRSLERRAILPAHSGVVAFAADGRHFAAADAGVSEIAVFQTSTLTRAFVLRDPDGATAIAFSPDGQRLATGSRGGNLTLWELGSRRRLGSVRAHVGELFAVTFLSDRRVASGGRDGIIRIWEVGIGPDPQGPIEVVALRGHLDYVYSLALSPDGEWLVSGSGDTTVRIWETQPLARRRAARRAELGLREADAAAGARQTGGRDK
jgi:WD40 repeat protein